MRVRWITNEVVGPGRGEAVICIPVYGGHELFVACLDSVLTHTPAEVTILICDDASPDARTAEYVRELECRPGHRDLLYLRQARNVGFPANVNGGFAAAAPADVVVLNSDCEVGAGWLEGLRDAAYSSDRVATATALTNHGTIVSVPHVRRPGPVPIAPWSLERAAAVVRQRSQRIRPRLPTAIGHCMYIKRSALDLVGQFDEAFAPGYGEEVDFSQRCLRHGLCHVLADDVFVAHHGGASFAAGGERARIQDAHEQMIAQRYPYYHDGLRALERTHGPLSRALGVARRSLIGTAVTIDLRGTSPNGGGREVLALLRALGDVGLGEGLGDGDVLRPAVLLEQAGGPTAAEVGGVLPGVEMLRDVRAARARGADVVHRLHTVDEPGRPGELASLGDRLILTQRDLCEFANPAAFADFDGWEAHRTLTRQFVQTADAIVFASECARADALAEGLVTADRASVVAPGVDHLTSEAAAPRPPRDGQLLGDERGTILCLGPSAPGANRVFALWLMAQLQHRHGWSGRLVLADCEARAETCTPPERACLDADPQLAAATVVLSALTEAERAWLLSHAALVIDPAICAQPTPVSLLAAAHGAPCLAAPPSTPAAGDQLTTLVAWDPAASADQAHALLSDPGLRRRNLEAIRRLAAPRTWRATAEALLALYEDVAARPSLSSAAPRPRVEGSGTAPTGARTRPMIRAWRRRGTPPGSER